MRVVIVEEIQPRSFSPGGPPGARLLLSRLDDGSYPIVSASARAMRKA